MAVDVSQLMEYAVRPAIDTVAPGTTHARGPYLSIAIFDGTQWASLCPDLDVASCGPSAEEALSAVEEAASEVLAVSEQEGLKPKGRVSDADLRDFLLAHQGPVSIVGRNFFV